MEHYLPILGYFFVSFAVANLAAVIMRESLSFLPAIVFATIGLSILHYFQ
jgi:hypothetical protein